MVRRKMRVTVTLDLPAMADTREHDGVTFTGVAGGMYYLWIGGNPGMADPDKVFRYPVDKIVSVVEEAAQ